jgi:hypothetical protein
MTSFTGLAEKRDADVLEAVFCDHSFSNFISPLVHATRHLTINGPTGEECLCDCLLVFEFGGYGFGIHVLIVGSSTGGVNCKVSLPDRALAERFHAIRRASAPAPPLPRLWLSQKAPASTLGPVSPLRYYGSVET